VHLSSDGVSSWVVLGITSVIILECFRTHGECRNGRCVKAVVMVLGFSVFMCGCCYGNGLGWPMWFRVLEALKILRDK
jgi:hypothetical protein